MLHVPIVHAHDVGKQIPQAKKFPWGWKCYKTIGSCISYAFIEIWSTWEVWRALEKLELLWVRLEQLLCIFHALQTSCVLHILMNTCWCMNQLLTAAQCYYLQNSHYMSLPNQSWCQKCDAHTRLAAMFILSICDVLHSRNSERELLWF